MDPDAIVNHRAVPEFVMDKSARPLVAGLTTPYGPVKQPPNVTITQPMSPPITVSAAPPEAEARSPNLRPMSTGDGNSKAEGVSTFLSYNNDGRPRK
jgi:hypothetical protein